MLLLCIWLHVGISDTFWTRTTSPHSTLQGHLQWNERVRGGVMHATDCSRTGGKCRQRIFSRHRPSRKGTRMTYCTLLVHFVDDVWKNLSLSSDRVTGMSKLTFPLFLLCLFVTLVLPSIHSPIPRKAYPSRLILTLASSPSSNPSKPSYPPLHLSLQHSLLFPPHSSQSRPPFLPSLSAYSPPLPPSHLLILLPLFDTAARVICA